MLRLLINDRFDEMSSFYFDYCREELQELLESKKDSEKSVKAWDDWGKIFPKAPDTEMTKYLDSVIYGISRERKHWSSAIIFGAMCLEAFIYDYAAHNFSDTYVKKYLDKLDLKAKFMIVPKLVTGKPFPTDSQAFQGLQKLVEERNKLVHHKSQPWPEDTKNFPEFLKKLEEKYDRRQQTRDIFSPYEAVVEVLTELKRLDSKNKNNLWWELKEVD